MSLLNTPPAFAETAFATPEQGAETCWALLGAAVRERRAPLHVLTLGTVDAHGAPQQRMVTVRAVDATQRTLRFHVDQRSPKAEQLALQPFVSLLGYDASCKLQIRLSGLAHLHLQDAVAQAAWADSQPMSRACYRSAHAPSSLLPAALAMTPDERAQREIDRHNLVKGRENFCVVRVHITRLDWVWLTAAGHVRAAVAWDAEGAPRAEWLAP